MAWTQFTSSDSGSRLLPSSNRDRLVDVCEELVKVSLLLVPQKDSLDDRFSERKEKEEHGRLRRQEEVEAAKKGVEKGEALKRMAKDGGETA